MQHPKSSGKRNKRSMDLFADCIVMLRAADSTPQELAGRSKVSVKTIYRYLKVLEKRRLARVSGVAETNGSPHNGGIHANIWHWVGR